METAQKLRFSSLMINAGDDFAYLNDLCERARKANIDFHYSFLITGTTKDKDWWQVVSSDDEVKVRRRNSIEFRPLTPNSPTMTS